MATSDGFQKSDDGKECVEDVKKIRSEREELIAKCEELFPETFAHSYEKFPEKLSQELVEYKESDVVSVAAIRSQLEEVEILIDEFEMSIDNVEDEIAGRGIPWDSEYLTRVDENKNMKASRDVKTIGKPGNYSLSRFQLLAVFSLALFSALFVIFDLQSLIF
ncbi:hypothetical protein CRE_28994 [Caenorhabditis remanei]|uniref:Uncharacterized protein n=1 Tax=Caenorhabditis remanei TaxID=31234 RepID=E3N5E3_CAERE|nr:hypothetical protein CRE_28994 [Caenorhabditis remanei]